MLLDYANLLLFLVDMKYIVRSMSEKSFRLPGNTSKKGLSTDIIRENVLIFSYVEIISGYDLSCKGSVRFMNV